MLTGKQKRYLRSLAVQITPSLQVGKLGISDNVVLQLEEALTARELAKVRVLSSSPVKVNDVASILSERTESDIVQVIGRSIVFYRQGEKPEITLPE